jgi:eIF4-gamma/eIF5/eIF2-epsilon
MLTGFYNEDVIEEGDIRMWYLRVRGKEIGKSEGYCRQIVERLLERLDEQSSEEESDS